MAAIRTTATSTARKSQLDRNLLAATIRTSPVGALPAMVLTLQLDRTLSGAAILMSLAVALWARARKLPGLAVVSDLTAAVAAAISKFVAASRTQRAHP